ncbi:tetratricopeptide repeat protein [Dyadobacter sp. OTU695]|uniref:tetratricopeptide repeat protein n=1 Tax=Dyadobacter sp. OTU695 TaxID=3043860 RepID=UPI00313E6128
MKTYLSIILIALLIAVTGCGKKKQHNEAAKQPAAPAVTNEIPALYERQGELASATEWAKTKDKVKELRQKVSENPSDVKPRLQIAVIYLSEARITGEHPYYYPAVLKILDDVLAIEPQNFEATTFKASVKMSQHQFAEARDLAERARKINPNNAYVYGVLVDANVELGNYDDAVAMSDKMQALKPSLEAYSRASYLREIYGNYPGSIEAMKLAVDAGLPGSEPQCWAKNTLGHLYETTGQLKQAEIQYQEILAMRPSYAFALRGLAQVHKAAGQYDKALAELDKAAKVMPEFSFHEEMADIYALQGNKQKAADKYREVAKMLDEDARSGHSVDLELCKLYTKTNQLDSAIAFGLKEYAKRPKNIDVNHALAAAYFKDKNNDKAKQHIKVALRTGSRDPELLQVASAIAVATGDKAQGNRLLAQARKTNPRFVL